MWRALLGLTHKSFRVCILPVAAAATVMADLQVLNRFGGCKIREKWCLVERRLVQSKKGLENAGD